MGACFTRENFDWLHAAKDDSPARKPARDRRPCIIAVRAALFARHSSGQQRAASNENQFRIDHVCAKCEDWTFTHAYEDFAVSGGRVIRCFGVQAPHEDSRRGLIESVVAETLDRVNLVQADVRA